MPARALRPSPPPSRPRPPSAASPSPAPRPRSPPPATTATSRSTRSAPLRRPERRGEGLQVLPRGLQLRHPRRGDLGDHPAAAPSGGPQPQRPRRAEHRHGPQQHAVAARGQYRVTWTFPGAAATGRQKVFTVDCHGNGQGGRPGNGPNNNAGHNNSGANDNWSGNNNGGNNTANNNWSGSGQGRRRRARWARAAAAAWSSPRPRTPPRSASGRPSPPVSPARPDWS